VLTASHNNFLSDHIVQIANDVFQDWDMFSHDQTPDIVDFCMYSIQHFKRTRRRLHVKLHWSSTLAQLFGICELLKIDGIPQRTKIEVIDEMPVILATHKNRKEGAVSNVRQSDEQGRRA
jgi:hypothetical protein